MIVKTDQLAQSERACQRTGLMGDPLHQTTIAHENPGVMVDNLMTVAVKLRRQGAFGDGHTDGVRQPLAQRAGGGFHPRGIAMLRVAGRFRVQLTELLQFRQRQIVAGQVQQTVEQHRRVAVGQNKTVAVHPARVLRIVLEKIVPQHFGNVCHPHWRTGVAGIGFLHRVHAQGADGVGKLSSGHSFLRETKVTVWRQADLPVCVDRRRTGGYPPPAFRPPSDPDYVPSGTPPR